MIWGELAMVTLPMMSHIPPTIKVEEVVVDAVVEGAAVDVDQQHILIATRKVVVVITFINNTKDNSVVVNHQHVAMYVVMYEGVSLLLINAHHHLNKVATTLDLPDRHLI